MIPNDDGHQFLTDFMMVLHLFNHLIGVVIPDESVSSVLPG